MVVVLVVIGGALVVEVVVPAPNSALHVSRQ
jgi:hypothetical protein